MRRTLTLALILISGICLFWRIQAVNSNAPQWPTVMSNIHDTVELSGAFAEYDEELTDGYSITVDDVEALSPIEYVDAYGHSPEIKSEGKSLMAAYYEESGITNDGSDRTELVVTMTVENRGNEAGHLHALSWKAIDSNARDIAFTCDFGIWKYANPAMENQVGFTIKPGSTLTLHVPFSANSPFTMLENSSERSLLAVEETDYELLLTNVPIRHVVDLGKPDLGKDKA